MNRSSAQTSSRNLQGPFMTTRLLLLAALVLSCGGRSAPTGSARVLVTASKGLIAAQRTHLTISGGTPAMAGPIDVDLTPNGAAWTVFLGRIPAGTGRIFHADAYDAPTGGNVIFQGVDTAVTIVANSTAVVTLLLEQKTPPDPFHNHAPVIDAIIGSDAVVGPGGSSQLQVVAHDPDGPGDPLSFAWTDDLTPEGADFSAPSAASTTWTAPAAANGPAHLSIMVTDTHHAVAGFTFVIDVSPNFGAGSAQVAVDFNTWPGISLMTVTNPQAAPGGGTTIVSVTASDNDGDDLQYDWSTDCQGASFAPASGLNAAGATTTFTAGDQPTTPDNSCQVAVHVTDQRGGVFRGGHNDGAIRIYIQQPTLVNVLPQVDRFEQHGARTVGGDPITLRVWGHDPDSSGGSDQVTVTWTASGGTFGAGTPLPGVNGGNGIEVGWSIPACSVSGPATATATLTDGRGGQVTQVFSAPASPGCPDSCLTLLNAGYTASGTFEIGPGGAANALTGWCNQTDFHGGWLMVGVIGDGASPDMFTTDVNLPLLAQGQWPASTDSAHFNLARFNSWGRNWTWWGATDSSGDATHLHDAFWRPADSSTVTLGMAGADWRAQGNIAPKMLLLNTTSAAAVTNTTWIFPPGTDDFGSVDPPWFNSYMFCYRDITEPNVQAACLDANGQTQACQAPPSCVVQTQQQTGTNTAAPDGALGDGAPHRWEHRGVFFVKPVNGGAL